MLIEVHNKSSGLYIGSIHSSMILDLNSSIEIGGKVYQVKSIKKKEKGKPQRVFV